MESSGKIWPSSSELVQSHRGGTFWLKAPEQPVSLVVSAYPSMKWGYRLVSLWSGGAAETELTHVMCEHVTNSEAGTLCTRVTDFGGGENWAIFTEVAL